MAKPHAWGMARSSFISAVKSTTKAPRVATLAKSQTSSGGTSIVERDASSHTVLGSEWPPSYNRSPKHSQKQVCGSMATYRILQAQLGCENRWVGFRLKLMAWCALWCARNQGRAVCLVRSSVRADKSVGGRRSVRLGGIALSSLLRLVYIACTKTIQRALAPQESAVGKEK